MKVLMACPNYWNSTFQVNTHKYAKQFAINGWEVAYISDPISPLHFFGSSDREQLIERLKSYLRDGSRDRVYGQIWEYVPGALVVPTNKPVLRAKVIANTWMNYTLPRLERILINKGFDKVDLLWFESPIYYPLLKKISYSLSLLMISDRLDGFQKNSESVLLQLKSLIKQVDIIFCTSHLIINDIKHLRTNDVYYMPNGIDLDRFSVEGSTPSEIESIPRPRAVYVGAIEEWFDFDLLSELASMLPNISFVIIGPTNFRTDAWLKNNKSNKNVYFLGKKKHEELYVYLKNCDIGIIPFKAKNRLVEAIHPLKLYEYIASGLPVVSTKWTEIVSLTNMLEHQLGEIYVSLVDSADDFTEAIIRLIGKRNNIGINLLREACSWERRFNDILKIVGLESKCEN